MWSQLVGLNISASFNSAVTIYILIPILLIPQMILSGAIFSFDKLNKLVGNKEKVPVIADMMVSRWAFEGLAVRQFRDNKFEKAFYEYEKNESKEDFKSVYWGPKLLAKLDECKLLLGNKEPKKLKTLAADKELVMLELMKEIEENHDIAIDNEDLKGNFDRFDAKSIEYFKSVVNIYIDYYTRKYNEVNQKKDQILNKFMSSEKTMHLFSETKKNYFNESLADLVKNQKAKNKIIEYKGNLVQIKDPIYNVPLKPTNPLNYRTHLYAPQKYFAGKLIDTFWFNMGMIWLFTLLLCFTLYFETLKKIIELFSKFHFKHQSN